MSGRKISEVTSSVNVTETAIVELRNSQEEVVVIFDELKRFGIEPSSIAQEFVSIEQRWHTITSRMTRLKERIANRGRETHNFDSEYKEAKDLESLFFRILSDLRSYLVKIKQLRTDARFKHEAKAVAIEQSIAELEAQLNNRKDFGLFQSNKAIGQFTDPAEFAEMIGLGPTHLDDVKNLIALARKAAYAEDFECAKKLLREATELWKPRMMALKQLQHVAANDASTARAIAEFFADRGLSPSLELVNGQFSLQVRPYDDPNAEVLYMATFRPSIDRGNQAEHIVWDTPEGTGCCNIVADLNAHMRARGFLHLFTSKTSGGQTSVESTRSSNRSKTVDRRRV